ncbi:hypothetical protein BRADI_3g32656v3 [Brachypodium distachyon]|uniref:Uncharacterized protein n=1 Tax=Brachypodium distachyon TaxID=15368 RepID=A0A2K2D0P4_BRADI|nr:hypothetical protein BRADI_3g32656v3 [Brachypodium distachyon]
MKPATEQIRQRRTDTRAGEVASTPDAEAWLPPCKQPAAPPLRSLYPAPPLACSPLRCSHATMEAEVIRSSGHRCGSRWARRDVAAASRRDEAVAPRVGSSTKEQF